MKTESLKSVLERRMKVLVCFFWIFFGEGYKVVRTKSCLKTF